MRNRKKKFFYLMRGISALLLTGTAVFCVTVKMSEIDLKPIFDIMTAEMIFPTGNKGYTAPETNQENKLSSPEKETSDKEEENKRTVTADSSEVSGTENGKSEKENSNVKKKKEEFEYSVPTEEELEEYDREHQEEEKYPVSEFTITEGNQSYKNVQIKNHSSGSIDIKSELESETGFKIEDTDKPQVLIYHTHTSESFLKYDTGYFYESFYPRTTDTKNNICVAGEEIAKQLNKAGIKTIHDTTIHDYPSYNGAYDRSYETVMKYLEKYPTIKVVLDIHRDGIGSDTQKTKPVFTADGKKAAQIMILSGYNYDNDKEFEDWEYNLRFALKIQQKAAEMYPDMVRPLNFGDFMYNMNINTGSLLIEIGAESNTLEEVRYSGYLLGNVLSELFKEKKQ